LYPKLFFPSFDPAAGTLLSFSTFALAFHLGTGIKLT
jgi:hypothetical protein